MQIPFTIPPSRARAWTLAVVLWAFGLATTTLLVGLWGRSVTTDQPTLEAGARSAINAEVVSDRVQGWLAEAIESSADVAGENVERALLNAAARPEVESAVDQIVGDVVLAALSPPGTAATINVASALEPLAPIVVGELSAQGVEIPQAQVAEALDAVSAVVLSTEDSTSVSGVVYRTRSFLTTVLVVALAALIALGSLAVALAEDHMAMVRSLAIRLAVSAVTFAIFLRVGAWAINPDQGRSPLAEGGSVLLGSNHLVLFVFAAAALAVALAAGVVIRRRRSDPKGGQVPPVGDDEPTEERVLVGV